MSNSLYAMQQIVHDCNLDHGWFDQDRTMGDDIALLHSEVSEMFEAFRNHRISSEVGQRADSPNYDAHSVHAEAADILIRLLDTCYRHNIDLPREFQRKMRYNEERPYRHGDRAV